MPFLIAYAFVNYAYVSLAMSFDLLTITLAKDSAKYGSMQKIGDLDELYSEHQGSATVEAGSIVGQPYLVLNVQQSLHCFRWLVNLLIISLLDFWFAVAHFAVLMIIYFYIGRICPQCSPGISTFSIPHVRTAFSSVEAIGIFNRGPSFLTKEGPSDLLTEQINKSNSDYQDRKQYHYAESVT